MEKTTNTLTAFFLLILVTNSIFAQSVKIGPRITGNFNIYNQDRLTGTWNGIGIGIGGVVDISFSKHLGILTNLTGFDMKNFSNSTTNNNTTTETSLSLAYLTIDPLFKAEFSGFYMLAGFSIGVKLSSSGEVTQSAVGRTPTVQSLSLETNAVKFDIASGIGYNFALTQSLFLGSDFMVYVPITGTYDTPGIGNSTLTLKLGTSIKFRINERSYYEKNNFFNLYLNTISFVMQR